MIRAKTSDVEVLTTLGADRLKMAIDPDGMVHITDLLTNMYSDEEMAVLREYSTNARDSHIAAGCPERPIEVTLPVSSWELPSETKGRFLRIKDYGVGLSVDEIAEIFSFYGKSTKDKSNDQQGMMGIGGKSGLVESFGSFQMTAVKDGRKTIVMVGRNEATEPVMDLVSVTDTDEPNGVEIELPTLRHNYLAQKARQLFRFWPEGSVLVDGKAPERLQAKVEVSSDMWVCTDLKSDYIVMGDVPYPVKLDGKLASGHNLVIFVPIGAVTIAPSREALRMTPETKDEIARLLSAFDQKAKTVVQDKVNEAKTKAEAMRLAIKWRSAFNKDADLGLTFKGVKIPVTFEVDSFDGKGGIAVTEHEGSKLSAHSWQKTIYAGTLQGSVLVHGFAPSTRFTATHKKKLEAWAKANKLDPHHYVLTDKRLAHGWFDSKMRVDWETVKKIKVTTAKGKDGRERPKGSYDMWLAGTYSPGTPAADIPLDEEIFFMDREYFSTVSRSYHTDRMGRERRKAMLKRYPNATFVELTSNRVAKFCRDFPTARHAKTILTELYDEFKATANRSDLLRIAVEEARASYRLSRLDPALVDDPEVKKAIRLAKQPVNTEFHSALKNILSLTGRRYDNDLVPVWKDPLDKYPLFNGGYLEHSYTYMNAIYSQEKK